MTAIRIVSIAMALGLGMSAVAMAQDAPPAAPAKAAVAAKADKQAPTQVIKPGDRNCIRDTGSLIPAKKGQCLQGAFGRSYSAKELRSTGQINTADALRMLDPAIH